MTSYYHYDGQLSTRQLTDGSANITDGYTYDAFGILLNMFGATENDYLYTGEQYDPNVGFYYLRARYYNQSVGRFLTMDTFSGTQFEPLSLHKYLYCEGNPINKWDPSGNYTLNEMVISVSIGMLFGSIGHLTGYLLQDRKDRNWDWWDFGASVLLGGAGGALGVIYSTVIASIAINAILSGIQYSFHTAHTSDNLTVTGFLLSAGIGSVAGLISGRIGRSVIGSGMRGFWSSFVGTSTEVVMSYYIEETYEYVEENTIPAAALAVKKILYLIFGGKPPGPPYDPVPLPI